MHSIKNSKNYKGRRAFTLVELVIVIAVIAVLSAILVPTFSNIINNSKKAKLDANLKTISSELVTRSLTEEIFLDPAGVKQVARELGFDFSSPDFFVPDGYSVWYDQKNYNLRLIPDAETLLKDNEASLNSFVNSALYGDFGVGSAEFDNLPRFPEAITPDKNLLIVATNEANQEILTVIERMYNIADSTINGVEGINAEIENNLSNVATLMSENVHRNYIHYFNTDHTLYVDSTGKILGLTGNNRVVENVLVHPAAETLHSTFVDNNFLTFECSIVLPSKVDTLDSTVEKVFGSNSVSFICTSNNIPTHAGLTNINNLTFNTVKTVGSSASADTVSSPAIDLTLGVHFGYVTNKESENDLIEQYDSYTAQYQNGYTITTILSKSDASSATKENSVNVNKFENVTIQTPVADYLADTSDDAKGNALRAKYVSPRLWFNMKEIRNKIYSYHTEKFGAITDKDDNADNADNQYELIDLYKFTIYEKNYGKYRTMSFIAIYHVWNANTNAYGDDLYGARLGNSIGYITSILEWSRNDETKYVAFDMNAVETLATDCVAYDANTAYNAGYIRVELPAVANTLDLYKNVTVKAYFNKSIQLYNKAVSSFNNEYFVPFGNPIVATSESSVDLVYANAGEYAGKWVADGKEIEGLKFKLSDIGNVDTTSADAFKPVVQLNRIEVCDEETDRVLFVKYYNLTTQPEA